MNQESNEQEKIYHHFEKEPVYNLYDWNQPLLITNIPNISV